MSFRRRPASPSIRVMGSLFLVGALVLIALANAPEAAGGRSQRGGLLSGGRSGPRAVDPLQGRPTATTESVETRKLVFPATRSRSFELKASHGYILNVFDLGGQIVLEARTQDRRVEYSARSEGRGNLVKARFGSLGSIDMEFIPEKDARHSREPGCRGRGAIVQPGRFVGRFRWRGEKGFSSAETRLAHGTFIQKAREVCSVRVVPRPVFLLARSRRPSGRSISIETEMSESQVVVDAVVEEAHSKMTIRRGLVSVGPEGVINAEPDGSTSVKPGQPFSGSAEFVPGSGGDARWLGSLAGEFAGLGNIRLAGEDFHAWRSFSGR